MEIERIPPETTVIYLHIPKTAGTTLHRIIERQYPVNAIYSVGLDKGESVDALENLSLKQKKRIRMFRGHMSHGVHYVLPGAFAYFTVLRDPVERVISYYHFIKRIETHYLHDHLWEDDVDLKSFITNKTHVMIDNAQTRIVSGAWHGPKFGTCGPALLDEAKRNLRRDFAAVGLVERFDESLLLFARLFGWRNLFYTRKNVSRHRPRRVEYSKDAIAAIVSANRLDLELYNFARGLFEAQVSALGPGFARRVKLFTIVNAFLSPWIKGYWMARKVSVRAAAKQIVSRIRT